MVASTLPVALCIILLIYVPIMRRRAWAWLCHALLAIVAVACVRQRTVHLQYIGIEVAAFGCLLTYLDPLRFVRARAPNAKQAAE